MFLLLAYSVSHFVGPETDSDGNTHTDSAVGADIVSDLAVGLPFFLGQKYPDGRNYIDFFIKYCYNIHLDIFVHHITIFEYCFICFFLHLRVYLFVSKILLDGKKVPQKI